MCFKLQTEIRDMEWNNKMYRNNFCCVNSDCFSEEVNFILRCKNEKKSIKLRREG